MLGDLLDREALQTAMRGCDAVVHLAAAADVDDVAQRPAEAEAVNARGTLNVLEAARGAGVARVVYASTIWVYGSATGTVDEDHAVELPDHLYTATKLAGEMYCRSYSALYGLRLHGPALRDPLRPAGAAGGRDPDLRAQGAGRRAADDRGRGPAVAALRLRRGPGRRRRARPGPAGRRARLQPRRRRERHRARDRRRGAATSSATSTSSTPRRARRTSPAPRCRGARAAAELGWQPATSFAEGVRRYVEWHGRDTARPRRAGPGARCGACAAGRASRPGSSSLVLSWLTVVRGGRRARRLPGRGPTRSA